MERLKELQRELDEAFYDTFCDVSDEFDEWIPLKGSPMERLLEVNMKAIDYIDEYLPEEYTDDMTIEDALLEIEKWKLIAQNEPTKITQGQIAALTTALDMIDHLPDIDVENIQTIIDIARLLSMFKH